MNNGMDFMFDSDGEPLFQADFAKLNAEEAEKHKIELRRWKEDFKDTFTTTAHGRRVLWWLIHETHMFRSCTQFNAGAYAVLAKQQIGNDIASIIGTEQLLASLIAVKKENGDTDE